MRVIFCLLISIASFGQQVPLTDSTNLTLTASWKQWKDIFRVLRTSGTVSSLEIDELTRQMKENLRPVDLPKQDSTGKKK